MNKIDVRKAFGDALADLGKENKDIVVVDADLASSTKASQFAKKFPERFFNLGVAEPDAVSTSAGLAFAGKIVFFSTFAVFGTGLTWVQIRQNICYPNLSVKLVFTHGGITVGADGASHQALEDIALMRVLPNMKVIVPADAHETRAAVKAAAEIPGPVYIRLPRENLPEIYNKFTTFTLGKARAHYHGQDATILACGLMVWEALQAKKELKESHGLDVGVINMSSIKPIDEREILAAASTSRVLLTAEDHSVIGGLGSAVAEVLVKHGVGKPTKMVGIPDCFGESGTPQELKEKFGLTKEKIGEIILKTLQMRENSSRAFLLAHFCLTKLLNSVIKKESS